MIRRLPPAHSPVSPAVIGAGARGLLAGGECTRRELRELLLRRFGALRVVPTDSGTSALRLALCAAVGDDSDAAEDTARGDEAAGGEYAAPGRDGFSAGGSRGPVALPAWSCYDVATAAVGAGVEVLFYDLDPSSLSPEPASLRRALERGARAVVAAHLYGLPVVWDAVERLAREHGATLIEDAAQGWGGRWRGAPLGSLGDLSVLSFGRGKGLCGGSGGALLVHAPGLVESVEAAARRLEPAARGWGDLVGLAGQWAFGRPSIYGLPAALPWLHLGETRFREPHAPMGQSAFSAGAVARALLRVEAEAEARRRNGRRVRELVARVEGLEAVRAPEGGLSGELRVPVLADPGPASRLRCDEARRLGILPGYPRPLPGLPLGAPGWEEGRAEHWPGARRLARELFTVPSHGMVGSRDLVRMERVVGVALGEGT